MSTPDTPIALVRLIERARSYTWQVLRCPFCLRPHYHGGGLLGGDPRKLLGPRISHCATDRRQYELVEVQA